MRTRRGHGKLQALVYDILPLEEGAGKRCSECGDKVVCSIRKSLKSETWAPFPGPTPAKYVSFKLPVVSLVTLTDGGESEQAIYMNIHKAARKLGHTGRLFQA